MKDSITIRPFNSSDTPHLISLFQQAVHTINRRHYSQEQVEVWAPKSIDSQKWEHSLSNNITFVAEVNEKIVGFADMDHTGYLDHLYVHPDFQLKGIALHLLKAIEAAARSHGLEKITTHCSITALKPALRMGFVIINEQAVIRDGIELTNYVMEKMLNHSTDN